MTNMVRVLLVEDDTALSESVKAFIQDFVAVDQVYDGEEGQFKAEQGIYDLIILDLMLPLKNGYDVLKSLRNKHIETPVLILTAKDGIDDKVHGFTIGADDYLTKPFHREELVLRIKALLKRSGHFYEENQLKAGSISVNLQNRSVQVADEPVQLNGKEFDLLTYLLENQNTIITKEQIFDRLWGFDSETSMTVVEVYMSNLRKKLKPQQADQMIRTLRNVGYMLEVTA
ncbi:response regulator transcription factor [Loigolactobacillus bifermentans]|uniref:OmpR family DNA-binding response regulator n=1 Tax=Loigolactobacillus bifermentans DSM 20003 TaxID=1423726 RepID=A0A0R1GRP7_9LACO|nr:response regulator transcription factor [Loigolactobacillus bifermentans]KRK34146.1 OmpR family DNA-binding response regulator [Loigolactobacillus bifermentans DSM 20003]QGG59266.1 response regulator [Loigolactobacillus bifermentans]